jgi:hypothetical protein
MAPNAAGASALANACDGVATTFPVTPSAFEGLANSVSGWARGISGDAFRQSALAKVCVRFVQIQQSWLESDEVARSMQKFVRCTQGNASVPPSL